MIGFRHRRTALPYKGHRWPIRSSPDRFGKTAIPWSALADLKKVTIPVLVMHGEDDQIAPIAGTARRAVKLLKNAMLKTYPGLPHGMATTQGDLINADMPAFFQS